MRSTKELELLTIDYSEATTMVKAYKYSQILLYKLFFKYIEVDNKMSQYYINVNQVEN